MMSPRSLQPLWKSICTVGVSLAGCALAAETRFSQDPFETYEVVVGEASQGQAVLSGFFLGGTVAELVVVGVEDSGDRRLRMYAFDGEGDCTGESDDTDCTWKPKMEAGLGPAVEFVDVVEIGGRDRLITYESGRISWFDTESRIKRPLVEVGTDYKSTHDLEGSPGQPGAALPHVDITRDLNRDGRDDLVMPDLDGFWISLQRNDGSFTGAVKLGPPEPFRDELVGNLNPGGGNSGEARTYGDLGITAATLPWYLSRVHEMDYDQDGLSDLVFWNKDHFEVHRQNESGTFAPIAETFSTDVAFDSEGVYSRAFDFRGQGVFSILFGFGRKTSGTVLHALRDLNGDGVADLVTLTLSGRGVTKQRSVYKVHFGRSTRAGADAIDAPGGTVFAPDASAEIRPQGKGGAMQPWGYSAQHFEDLDGDGRLEAVFREVAVGIGGMARTLTGKSVPVNLELYRMKGGTYPVRATFEKRIRRFAPFAGLSNIFFPPVLLGDVNGDGRADLVVGQKPKELHVFFGVAGADLFERHPRRVSVDLPSDERKCRLLDLNRDGKQDILVFRGPTERRPTELYRLTMLIAR